jgi:hypothetical protein
VMSRAPGTVVSWTAWVLLLPFGYMIIETEQHKLGHMNILRDKQV